MNFVDVPVDIWLDEACLLRTSLDLPLAAEHSLQAVVRHQLERLVPLPPSTLRFVSTAIERKAVTSRLVAEVCIVKESTINDALAFARRKSLRVRSVMVEQADRNSAAIWQPASKTELAGRRPLLRSLDVATGCLIVAAYGLHVWHLQARREELQHRVSELEQRGTAVSVVSAKAEAAEKRLVGLITLMNEPTPLAVLESLSKALPLDASISELRLRSQHLEIIGSASHATSLLSALERSSLLQDATFLAPITAEPSTSTEHYELAIAIRAARD